MRRLLEPKSLGYYWFNIVKVLDHCQAVIYAQAYITYYTNTIVYTLYNLYTYTYVFVNLFGLLFELVSLTFFCPLPPFIAFIMPFRIMLLLLLRP